MPYAFHHNAVCTLLSIEHDITLTAHYRFICLFSHAYPLVHSCICTLVSTILVIAFIEFNDAIFFSDLTDSSHMTFTALRTESQILSHLLPCFDLSICAQMIYSLGRITHLRKLEGHTIDLDRLGT